MTPQQLHPSIAPSTILDVLLPSRMAAYVGANDVTGMARMAHLMCDLGLVLGGPNQAPWAAVLSDEELRYKVINDAMTALWRAGEPEKSLELSQRFKSRAFCLPNIERARKTGNKPAARYLECFKGLENAALVLKGPFRPDGDELADAVRAAGEKLLEEAERLRRESRMLHAKLGGLIKPDDLINALPAGDPVAIVDLFVIRDGTIVHLISREGAKVRVDSYLNDVFRARDAFDLIGVWAKSRVATEISEHTWEGLVRIGDVLHDKLGCWLARILSGLGIGQVIIIYDALTRCLPLHLSRICGKEIKLKVPGVDTAQTSTWGAIFPIEYGSCLQELAVSQHQKRPRQITSVLALADPKSNLPGAKNTAADLASRVPPDVKYSSFTGDEANLANLAANIGEAEIVFIGAHGIFKPGKPADSFLEFHDGPWTAAEILDRPAFDRSPIMILSACEVGANDPGDDRAASGIPGALISAGAACVVAGLWPLEDMSTGYVVERFLHHLSHRGFRPAAALFRALQDLRNFSKQDAIERCTRLLAKMDEDGTADFGEQVRLNELRRLIRKSKAEYPFASMQSWGAFVIMGSGWATPAGAVVSSSPMAMIDALGKRERAQELVANGKYTEARELLEGLLAVVDGAERSRVLDRLAYVVWQGRPEGTDTSARQQAMALLEQAEDVARDDGNEQLVTNINATRQKIDL